MGISYYYLGFVNGGKILSVKLNQQAHVALLDTKNLQRYAYEQSYRHYGNLQSYIKQRYQIPYPAEWHIVIFGSFPVKQLKSEIRFR